MKNFVFILFLFCFSCSKETKPKQLDFIDEDFFALNSHCDTLIDEGLNKYALTKLKYSKEIDTLKNGDLFVKFYLINNSGRQLEESLCKSNNFEFQDKFNQNITNIHYYKFEENQFTLVKIFFGDFVTELPHKTQLDTLVNNFYNNLAYDTILFKNWTSMKYHLDKHKINI